MLRTALWRSITSFWTLCLNPYSVCDAMKELQDESEDARLLFVLLVTTAPPDADQYERRTEISVCTRPRPSTMKMYA